MCIRDRESLKFGIVGGIAHPQVDMTKVNYDKKPWTNNPTEQISYVRDVYKRQSSDHARW